MEKVLSRLIFFLSYRIFRYRYQVVLQNLSRSFPEMSYAEIGRVTGGFYRHFSNLLAEAVRLLFSGEKQLRKRVKVVNPELLEYYHRQNRNIIAVLGHYGNWEYLNILPKYLQMDVNAVYKPLSNKLFDHLVKSYRSRFGLRLFPVHQIARYMLWNKDRPELYLFIADQSPASGTGCQVDFMHQRTYMFNGAEKLAKAIGAAVVYADLTCTGKKQWEVRFSLVTEHPGSTGPHEITRLFAGRLEQTIRKDPSYWLWSHRRWKLKHG